MLIGVVASLKELKLIMDLPKINAIKLQNQGLRFLLKCPIFIPFQIEQVGIVDTFSFISDFFFTTISLNMPYASACLYLLPFPLINHLKFHLLSFPLITI